MVYMTVLSVDEEAVLLFPARSCTRLAAIEGITVPDDADIAALRLHVMLSEVVRDHVTPVAVPP